jgi:hypothetical protein
MTRHMWWLAFAVTSCTNELDVPDLSRRSERARQPVDDDDGDANDNPIDQPDEQEPTDPDEPDEPDEPNPTQPPSSCPPGTSLTNTHCQAEGLPALTSRTPQEVCDRFRRDSGFVDVEWVPGPEQCSLGDVPQSALDAALMRTNLYRYLAGVDETVLAPGLFEQQQACATTMAAMGYLSHQLSPDVPCYSDAAAYGAGSSNIANGTLLYSIDMYMEDWGNEDHYGHRRWVIGPFMSETQFGVHGNYSCMYTFGVGGGRDPGYVSWPPAGTFPRGLAVGGFTFESVAYAPTDNTEVWVRIDSAAEQQLPLQPTQGGYGHYGAGISFFPDVGSAMQTIHVRITNTAGGDVSYTIMPTDCG